MPNLRNLALSHKEQTESYGGNFHYNNYHPLLLRLILERSTGVSVSDYFEQNIWKKIGAENDGSWSLDSENSGLEKMESGINFRSIDFIKIGSMLIHGGNWNGSQIINSEWIIKSTLPGFPIIQSEYADSFLESKNIGYQYMWYGRPSKHGKFDFRAWGKYDQILYVSPSNGIVILRTGKTSGNVDDWSEVIKEIASGI